MAPSLHVYTSHDPASEKARQRKAEAMQYHTVSMLEKKSDFLEFPASVMFLYVF